MIIALGVLVFLLAAVLDIADTQHKIAIEHRDAHAAARWSVAMYLLGLVGLVGLLRVSLWLVVPEAVGLYLGSVFAIRRQAQREQTRG